MEWGGIDICKSQELFVRCKEVEVADDKVE